MQEGETKKKKSGGWGGAVGGGDADLMLTRHAERRQKSVGEEGELGQGAAGLMTQGGSHSVTRYSHTSQVRLYERGGGCVLGLFGLQGSPKLNEVMCEDVPSRSKTSLLGAERRGGRGAALTT